MGNLNYTFLRLLAASHVFIGGVDAFWRMNCGIIQTGRLDPIVWPGRVASHVHKVSGASNFGLSNTYEDLSASQCTSCEIQADKSAYWTPQLYYQHADGTFETVPNSGTVVYYLGRGENRSNIEPFPPGFKMLSGDPTLRGNDTNARTYSDASKNIRGRPLSDRVSFACLDSSGPMAEQNYMFRTDCDNGMRAQVQFPSCWDGRDYQPDQSHVAQMSQIDNGVCPPTHPRQLIHLFFEVIYGVNDVQKEAGGRFVFSNGDPTGFSFHADFMNAWDETVLRDAIDQCVNNDSLNGVISACPPLAKSQTPYFSTNCRERPAIVNEKVKGRIPVLPGCNPVTDGTIRAPTPSCPGQVTPSVNDVPKDSAVAPYNPAKGDKLRSGPWSFVGCVADSGNPRPLHDYSSNGDDMTIEKCVSTCQQQGLPLAGLEYSRECFCGKTLGSATANSCTGIPQMVCAGNATEWCGAGGLLSVWNDTSYRAPEPLVPGQTRINNGSATYAGCLREPAGARALTGASTVDASAMTNEACATFCATRGYALAGTEYSQECFCGDRAATGATNLTDISQCDMRCTGDRRSMCGGAGKLSVWSLGKKPSSGDSGDGTAPGTKTAANGTATYIGCYTDGTGGVRTLDRAAYASDAMTVDACASYCQGRNYALFGVEYGRECYCGNVVAAPASVASSDAECATPCHGDPAQICGAASRISLWNNTLYVPTRSPPTVGGAGGSAQFAYLGCYAEGSGGRALGRSPAAGSRSDATSDARMTVELCAAYCSGKGHGYMGVEYGRECFCNSEGPVNGAARAPEADCGMTCAGDLTEWCGGPNRINVYKASSS